VPSLEVSTTLGGAAASEYLVRVANPDATESSGVIELRQAGDERSVARAPYSVPANGIRYFRIPGEKAQRFGAVAVTGDKTVRAQEHFSGDGTVVIFDIPPRDDQRLRELRVHTGPSYGLTHAAFDETTHTPILTRRAAVYDSAALVLVPSRVFLALPAPEREALTAWVRAGGAIALSVSDERDLPRLADLVGNGVRGDPDIPSVGGSTYTGPRTAWSGGRLRSESFGASAELGLGRVHLLPLDAWSAEANGDVAIQEKLVALASMHRAPARFINAPWMSPQIGALDPNQGYRSVIALAGLLLGAQALITALAFRRLALRRGMGSAYRFVVGSSAVTFAAVLGLGVYAKGGFGARARELSFADAASGESVAWVERNRTYFASDTRTIEVTPRDPSNVIEVRARDSHAVLRVDDASANAVLTDVGVRPWQATAVTERGTTSLGGGVRIESVDGKIVVRNSSGRALRNVIVASSVGCFDFGTIASGAEKTSATPRSCTELGPDWDVFRGPYYSARPEDLFVSQRLTLLGQLEEAPNAPSSIDGFRVEKRTTLVRIVGGAS
jgi:hypothetical protein